MPTNTPTRDEYLQTAAQTAPSHRLHLMLLDGALRFGRQAADALARGDEAVAAAPLMRLLEIVGELLAGVRGGHSQVNDRLAKLYWFLFQRVSAAKINADSGKLAEALHLLEYERDTWRMACEKVAAESRGMKPPAGNKTAAPHAAVPRRDFVSRSAASGGFSLEA